MREVVLDTETTGLNRKGNGVPVSSGHRIVEVACVELLDGKISGKKFHTYVNPERKIDKKAIEIHGLTNKFLKDKPLFADIAGKLLEFIKDSVLIIHNAPFDIEFLDEEFRRLDIKAQPKGVFEVVDTLQVARNIFPCMKNDLNSLAKHFDVKINREKHGALVDCEILAHVYSHLMT